MLVHQRPEGRVVAKFKRAVGAKRRQGSASVRVEAVGNHICSALSSCCHQPALLIVGKPDEVRRALLKDGFQRFRLGVVAIWIRVEKLADLIGHLLVGGVVGELKTGGPEDRGTVGIRKQHRCQVISASVEHRGLGGLRRLVGQRRTTEHRQQKWQQLVGASSVGHRVTCEKTVVLLLHGKVLRIRHNKGCGVGSVEHHARHGIPSGGDGGGIPFRPPLGKRAFLILWESKQLRGPLLHVALEFVKPCTVFTRIGYHQQLVCFLQSCSVVVVVGELHHTVAEIVE